MAELRTQPEQLGFFLWRRYNVVCLDTLPQDGDLGLQEAYLSVVPGSEDQDEQPEDGSEGIGHRSLMPR